MKACVILLLVLILADDSRSHNCTITGETADCSNKGLGSIPTDLPKTISQLDLSGNRIVNLTNNIFRQLDYINLTGLKLDNNGLATIGQDAFQGLDRLTSLYIGSNKLNLLNTNSTHIFKHLISLKELDISRNDPPTYYPFIENLINLFYLSVDLVPKFNRIRLTNLTQLKKVVFDRCNMKKMTKDLFANMPNNVEELYFRECVHVPPISVERDFLKHFEKLEVLSFFKSALHLQSVLYILYPFEHKTMRKLDFTKVNNGYEGPKETMYPEAVTLTSEMMTHLQKICVTTLILAENGIVDFENGSLLHYDHPDCLKHFVITGNRFSIISSSKAHELFVLNSKLVNLELFDMSYTPLSYRNVEYIHEKYVDSSLPKYKDRTLLSEDSYLTSSPYELKSTSPNSEYCEHEKTDRSRNGIRVWFPIPPKLRILRMSNFLAVQGLGHNVVLKNASNLRHLDFSYYSLDLLPNITFEQPDHNITFVDFSGIPGTIFTCSSKPPLPLLEHAKTVNFVYMKLYQTFAQSMNIFQYIPLVENLNISHNSLWSLPESAFSGNPDLRVLIMSYNMIGQIPSAILQLYNLEILDVSHNLIYTINATMRNWLDNQNEQLKQKGKTFKLLLSGNVLKCACETVDVIQWLFKTEISMDKADRNYMCKMADGTDSNTKEVNDHLHELFGLCRNETWLQLGIGLLVSFVVLVIPIAIIINFRWRIAYWIYTNFRKVVVNKMKLKFKYDFYVSYGADGFYWVQNTLCKKLERSWGMTVCLEDRDILVGDICADAISKSIHDSRNVIFVITDGFRDKIWTTFEIERAKYEKYTNDLQRIIVIKRHVAVENFPAELHQIRQDVHFIEWSDDNNETGWDQLHVALFSGYV